MSSIATRSSALSLTGSSITHGAFSPATRKRNTVGLNRNKTDISIKAMTGQDEGAKFGIQGYTLPKHFMMLADSPKFSVPKESNKRYFDQVVRKSETIPEPGKYTKTMLWKGKMGVMKGVKRTTFIEDNMKRSAKMPGPSEYSPEKKFKQSQVKFEKSQKSSFLDNV